MNFTPDVFHFRRITNPMMLIFQIPSKEWPLTIGKSWRETLRSFYVNPVSSLMHRFRFAACFRVKIEK